MTQLEVNEQDQESSMSAKAGVIIFIAAALGIAAAVLVLPNWLPGMAGSLSGAEPKVFWYLSRSTALVAMGILWASMMLGVGITNKMARLWPGAPAAFALHEYLSLLGLGFAAFHGLILLGDHYANFSLAQVLTPFRHVRLSSFLGGAWAAGILHLGDRDRQLLYPQPYRSKRLAAAALCQLLYIHGRPVPRDFQWNGHQPALGAGFLLADRR